jgi:hypothetical protein
MTMKRLSRFILVTFEANDAYGSKTQDKRQQSLKKGIENMQNKPHKYEQKQTYSGGENTTKTVIHKGNTFRVDNIYRHNSLD